MAVRLANNVSEQEYEGLVFSWMRLQLQGQNTGVLGLRLGVHLLHSKDGESCCLPGQIEFTHFSSNYYNSLNVSDFL